MHKWSLDDQKSWAEWREPADEMLNGFYDSNGKIRQAKVNTQSARFARIWESVENALSVDAAHVAHQAHLQTLMDAAARALN
jgi:hypothetical protein